MFLNYVLSFVHFITKSDLTIYDIQISEWEFPLCG
jgi:hypothetical protein